MPAQPWFEKSTLPLEDAQITISLLRLHAEEWHIDPHKVGVLGFSAGGYLVAEISTDFDAPFVSAYRCSRQRNLPPGFRRGSLSGPSVDWRRNLRIESECSGYPADTPNVFAASRK